MVTLETAFQSFGPPVYGSVPQSTMGSGGAAWKAAMASRWVVLVGDHRPKILLIVKLGVVLTAFGDKPPTANVLPLQLPTCTSPDPMVAARPSTEFCGAKLVAPDTGSPPLASAVAPATPCASATAGASRPTITCRPSVP